MKRIFILIMIATLLLSMTGLTGCSDDGYESDEYYDEEEDGTDQNSADSSDSASDAGTGKNSKGLFMQVDKLYVRLGPGIQDVSGRKRHR